MVTSSGKEKQAAIFDALLDLIAERGFHGAAMSQVARRSGVSAGIIYHYFASKEDLIHALYHRIKAGYTAALVQGDIEKLAFPDDLKHIWLNAYHYFVAHPRETTFLEQYENSPYYQGMASMDEAVQFSEDMRLLVGKIEQNISSGAIWEIPFPVLHELTLGVAAGLAKQQITGAVDLDDAQLEKIADSISRAVTKI